MIRKLLCLTPIVATLFILIFWKDIYCGTVTYLVNRYCAHHFGQEIDTKQVTYQHGYVSFVNPKLTYQGSELSAEKVLIGIDLSLIQRSVDITVIVEESFMEFFDEVTNFQEIISDLVAKTVPYWLFEVNTSFTIQNGTVRWKQGGYIDEAGFQFNAFSEGVNKQAVLAFSLEKESNQSNYFQLKVDKSDQQPIEADLLFRDVEAGKLLRISHSFNNFLEEWKVKEGMANGNLHCSFPEGKRPSLWGKVTLLSCAFENPQLKIQGLIPEVTFHLKADLSKKKSPKIEGDILIHREGTMTFPNLKLTGLKGEITFLPDDGTHIDFSGNCHHDERHFELFLKGKANIFDESQAALDLCCEIAHQDTKRAQLTLAARQLGSLYNCAEIELNNFGKEEFDLIQATLSPHIPEISSIQLHGGKLGANGIIYLDGYSPIELRIDRILGEDLFLESQEVSLNLKETLGDFFIDLSSADPVNTVEANFSVEEGTLRFIGSEGVFWHFNKIKTDLNVRKGVLQKSILKGNLGELQGVLEMDWTSRKEFAKIHLSGESHSLIPFFTQSMRSRLKHTFNREKIEITGGLSWIDEGAQFDGFVSIIDDESNTRDTIALGFDIERSSEKLWQKWPADVLAASYWNKVGFEAMRKVTPPLVTPFFLLESNWIQSEVGIHGFLIRNGWFEAKHLPLHRYLSPFLFPEGQANLYGSGSFTGIFDHRSLAVEYDVENLLLENTSFSLKADKIESERGVHFFDFQKGTHYGTVPLKKATYHEKNSGLNFVDTDSVVFIEESNIHFSSLFTHCQGVDFRGDVDLVFELPNDGRFKIEITVDHLKGTVKQIQDIAKEFGEIQAPFPLSGDVSLTNQGAKLILEFEPDDFHFDAQADGKLTNVEFSFGDSGLQVEGGKLQFSYDHQKRVLDLKNIYGDLYFGQPEQKEHYILSGEYMRWLDFERGLVVFDVWVGDRSRDIVRLVGQTVPAGVDRVEVQIDSELTHFGDVHPSKFNLTIKNGAEIEHFNLGLDLRLSTLLHDLKRLGRSGFFPLSPNVIKELNYVKTASGTVNVEFTYDGLSNEFVYHVIGNDLQTSEYAFKSCQFTGRKNGEYWCVDSLILDDWFLNAYFKNNDDLWNFNQLHFSYGDVINMDLNGDYLIQENVIKAHVNALELDFDSLKKSPFGAFVSYNDPHGKMNATGEIVIDFTKKQTPGPKVDALLDATLTDWDMKGLHFQNVQNVSCHFLSDKGITVRNLKTNLLCPETGSVRAELSFEKAFYDFMSGETVFDSLDFHVPVHHLPWFATTMGKCFPDVVTEGIAETMSNCKLQGSFEGTFNYEYNAPYTAMQLALKDGKYLFLNTEHEFKDLVMEYDPFEFKFSSQYRIGDQHFWMHGRSTSPNLEEGELILSEEALENSTSLAFLWECDSFHGFSIKNVEGSLFGMEFQLQRDPVEPLSQKAIYLVGQVSVDPQRGMDLFPEEMAQTCTDWDFCGNYRLNGKWKFQKEGTEDYVNKVHFIGTLSAEDFFVKGYQFQTLESHLEYTPRMMRLRDFEINDSCGAMTSEKIDFLVGSDEHWHFSIPRLNVQHFRPSLLRELTHSTSTGKKSLLIQELSLEGCQGNLTDSSTIVGRGSLSFTNRSKKWLQNTLFQIPSDILSRIGLDLAVLTPVTGGIDYKIQDGKIYLTKFKDIYSEGKLSKFNLSPAAPSTVGFDGKLNVQVRMKQYNLLFKLAELFTVNIRGDLEKPLYSLQKQAHSDL